MKKKFLSLSIVALTAVGGALALGALTNPSLFTVKGTSTTWYHYESVEPTCASYGIKEYWTDCQGESRIVEPTDVTIVEMGQPSAAAIQLIVDTYGDTDERIIAKSDEHNFVADPDCIGREVCSICGEAYQGAGANPSFDFTTNLYGAYDVYDPWGAVAQDGWAAPVDAGTIKFVNYTDGDICRFHMPRIYFVGYSSLTIDVTVNYNLVTYALDDSFASSYQVSFAGYPLKLVFDNISETSMTVKILDAFGTEQVSATCTNLDVLNGNEGYVVYSKGSGNVGWDTFGNFTFVA